MHGIVQMLSVFSCISIRSEFITPAKSRNRTFDVLELHISGKSVNQDLRKRLVDVR
jgi:hypothetical protein